MNASDIYERLIRPAVFSVDPETAHHIAVGFLRVASRISPLLAALKFFQARAKPRRVFGVLFPNPVGLAAGFDKNGVALPAWAALGFGFVEIGTVTAQAQPGNPKPRIFRFPNQQAIINRLGFNNDGADVVARRLHKLRTSGRWPAIPVGINIGKSKGTPIEKATDDYLHSFRRLREFADYVVLNVSSPNTPELRSLQQREALQSLLHAVHEANRITRKPVLVKISPDLSTADLQQVISICEANEMAGIVATNTTLDHAQIPDDLDQEGGLSGAPLRARSTKFVKAIVMKSDLPVVASGGIMDAASAREKLEAGAQLLQVYTGYVYRGPGLLREIVDAL